MDDADKYRVYARQCIDTAAKAASHVDKDASLQMAQTWLGMIPERQRTPADDFETAIRERGTGHRH